MSLDVLRGLFILLMNVGFAVPIGVFPDWMYHRQFPSSNDLHFTPIPGLTWRDMTFGGFLFTMAAAIPVTMTVRIVRGIATWQLVLLALRRAFLLFVFALVIGNASPYWTNAYTPLGNSVAVVGWVACFLIFTRRRSDWNRKLFLGLEVLGWVTIIAIFALSERLIGQPFALNRRDDILPLLAFAALAGILIWRFTRTNHAIRLGILAAIVALRLASSSAGWVQELRSFSPAPWLFDWGTLDLLIIIIPGTIVGDALVEWMRTPLPGAGEQGWPAWRLRALAGLSVAIEPTLVLGLYFRQPLATTAILAALGGAIVYLIREARLPGERLVARILSWGLFWVFLGLLLEPLEGGINKVPGSISYYMTTGGNAMCLIAALTIVLDLLGVWRRYARPVAEVGENPLVGYMLMPLFVSPLLVLVPMYSPEVATQSGAIVRIALSVIAVGGLVSWMTRKDIFWRA